ncbi:hypothetical protein BD779DRAFT_1506912 [Infundibulicybe gibba]|nr:hypothetical protein BD779DRAFT_1506912 [Infundibulicybe gibba]
MPANRCYISPEKKWLIITLSTTLNPHEIAHYTGVSTRTVHRVLALWRDTGSVTRTPLQNGRPRLLTTSQVDYIEGLLERRPDMHLSEIQEDIAEVLDVHVSECTISRSLSRRGISRNRRAAHTNREFDEEQDQLQAPIAECNLPELHIHFHAPSSDYSRVVLHFDS